MGEADGAAVSDETPASRHGSIAAVSDECRVLDGIDRVVLDRLSERQALLVRDSHERSNPKAGPYRVEARSVDGWNALASRPEQLGAVMDTERNEGLLNKYAVTRLNDDQGKHADCRYFVLDPQHDPLAREALGAYANAAAVAGYVPLSLDLNAWLSRLGDGNDGGSSALD